MTSITSAELNYLVFRYLQESGFTHSAFTLGYEAGINKCTIDGNLIPPGALITFVQKGLQYLEMEANLSNYNGGFGLLSYGCQVFVALLANMVSQLGFWR
ncbi:hypothetical protein QUC31_003177 [Theobroma cacao]